MAESTKKKQHAHRHRQILTEYGSSASNAAAAAAAVGFHKICASDVKIMLWLSNDLEHILYWMKRNGAQRAQPNGRRWLNAIAEEIKKGSQLYRVEHFSFFPALNYNCLIRVLDQIVWPVRVSNTDALLCNYSLAGSFFFSTISCSSFSVILY